LRNQYTSLLILLQLFLRSLFCNHTMSNHSSTLSLHDALPMSKLTCADCTPGTLPSAFSTRRTQAAQVMPRTASWMGAGSWGEDRSEEHTSELQSRENLVCRLLLEKKNQY